MRPSDPAVPPRQEAMASCTERDHRVLALLRLLYGAHPLRAGVLGLASVVAGVCPVLSILALGELAEATERLLSSGRLPPRVWWLLALVMLLRGMAVVVSAVRSRIALSLSTTLDVGLRRGLLRSALEADLEASEGAAFRDSLSRADAAADPGRLRGLVETLGQGVSQVVEAATLVAAVSAIAWPLAVVYALLLWPCLAVKAKARTAVVSARRDLTWLERRSSAYSGPILGGRGSADVRFHGCTQWLIGKWLYDCDLWACAVRKVSNRADRMICLADWVVGGVVPSLAVLCLALLGAATPATVIVVLQATGELAGRLTFISYELAQMRASGVEMRDLWQFVGPSALVSAARQRHALPGIMAAERAGECVVRCRSVSYRYPGADRDALSAVDISVFRGEKVAVVGRNGAGKSTLVNILLGLYRPHSGTVTYQTSGAAAQRFSVLFQEFARYSLDLRHNIGLSDPDRIGDDTRLMQAASDGLCLDLILRYGLGQQTGPAFGGADLSTGQWQRIAFARAFFRSPVELLVLDEPVEAIDAFAEGQLLSRYFTTRKEVAMVFISHRLASVRHADKIIVLDAGRVVEQGSHSDLVAEKGLYAAMFKVQADAYATGV